ncbi:MAG: metalloregulator ArsR/SmtB family transcription factor [Candidatus Sumerlaeaceae bacterium]|nr:metalloregulator ArsR/SmtB family transcription factor [Candidatus Sumerlaeaceae bacterium]
MTRINKNKASARTSSLPQFSARYAAKAKIVKALAHPVRLYFAEVLAEKELCVCELQALVGLDVSTVSKHLSVMREAGVVRDMKQGTQVRYRLATPCLVKILSCIEQTLVSDLLHKVEVLSHE